jgi:HPt (histidine-containing phosphotransfer) domain-containing protein
MKVLIADDDRIAALELAQTPDMPNGNMPNAKMYLVLLRSLGDATGLQTAAHTLKGSAGYLAAAFVVEAAVELERIGREGRLADAPSAVSQLERAVAQLMPEIERATLA